MPAWTLWLRLLVLAWICATPPVQRLMHVIGRFADSLQSRAGLPELLSFLCAAVFGALPMCLQAVPPPSTHDEFAYLLAADTFAHGRLTNPPHRHWEHFETFHQIMQPTYAAKFPPGQGVALLLGRFLGNEIVGAWGMVALGAAAICWMLRPCLGVRWAIVGGLMAGVHPLPHWWGQIYWGGGVAMFGGALLGGAFLRALAEPRIRWGIVAGVATGILAFSRPFEGALLGLILLTILIIRSIRSGQAAPLLRRFVIPATLTLVPFAASLLHYNRRVTGEWLTMPYIVHYRQYMAAPLLWVQSLPPRPHYRHPRLATFHAELEFAEYNQQRGLEGFLTHGFTRKWARIRDLFMDPPTLWTVLVALPFALWRRTNADGRSRLAAWISMLVCVSFPVLHMLLTPWFRPQYLAPALGFFFLLLVVCLKQWSSWRMHRFPLGAGVAQATIIIQFVTVLILIHQMAQNPNPTGAFRDQMLKRLRQLPGEHLVLVQYLPGPQQLFEWVYNQADIDGSKVVLARDMGEQLNRRLFEYFPNRTRWRLTVAGNHVDLQPLPVCALRTDELAEPLGTIESDGWPNEAGKDRRIEPR